MMCGGCSKCGKTSAILLLVFGFFFLLQDLGIWAFWNISWWTVVFALMGVTGLAMAGCKDCKAVKGKK